MRNGFEIRVEWDPFTDLKSPVDYYEIGLLELLDCIDYNGFVHGQPAISFVMVGLQTSFTFDNVALEDKVTYVSVVKATNQAGLASSVYS